MNEDDLPVNYNKLCGPAIVKLLYFYKFHNMRLVLYIFFNIK